MKRICVKGGSRLLLPAAGIALLAGLCLASFAEDGAGSPVNGWRGDGSGRYGDADPPLNWERTAKSMRDLFAQARKPKDDAPPAKEDAIPDGVIRNWLLLGPIPLADDMKPEEPIPNAASLAPDENDKAGELSWKPVSLDGGVMDLCSLLNVPVDRKGVAAYAHTHLYSSSGRPVVLNALSQGQGCMRIWLNGTEIYSSGKNVDLDYYGARIVLSLRKGWNRLLVLNAKTLGTRKSWWISNALYGGKDSEYDECGIAWTTPVPMAGGSAPVIVGDRVFFTGENGSLLSADKASGKLLWVRTLTYFDFATDEERKADLETFAKLAPLVEKLKQLDETDLAVPWKPPALEKDSRGSVEAEIDKLMRKVSRDRYSYSAPYGCEAGFTAPTPVTDGRRVYVLYGTCIAGCYDRDGNCLWKRLLPHRTQSEFHGYTTSPLLVDGKLVLYFDDFTVLDAATGAVVLERPHHNPDGKPYYLTSFYGSGCVIPVGADKVIYYPNGEFVRLSDGKTLSIDKKQVVSTPQQKIFSSRCATAALVDGVVYAQTREGVVDVFRIAAMKADALELEVKQHVVYDEGIFPYYYEPRDCASPLVHEGLVYCVNDFGVLTVVDAEKGEVAYQELLDAGNFVPFNGDVLRCGHASSPTLGGKRIYIWGNQGTCLVLEPGHVFKLLARNRIENCAPNAPTRQEATITNPVFEGGRIYYRGERTLYCIGGETPAPPR